MIDLNLIISGLVTVAVSTISSFITWFFTRRKYNTEVDSNEIKNLKDSLEFYEEIVRDNNKKLAFYIDLAENNRVEVYRLKGVIHRLLNNSCLDNGCIKRKFYTEEQIREILGELAPQNKVYKGEKINGTNTEKKS